MAPMMVLIALTLAMPGDTMERGALKPIADMGLTEENMALFFAWIGAVRCVALYLDGHINSFRVVPNGAIIRTEAERQTEALERIEREQAVANRAIARSPDRP